MNTYDINGGTKMAKRIGVFFGNREIKTLKELEKNRPEWKFQKNTEKFKEI